MHKGIILSQKKNKNPVIKTIWVNYEDITFTKSNQTQKKQDYTKMFRCVIVKIWTQNNRE